MMLEPPSQAVILAGGRGTRLAPVTDTLPKPMVPFHGKPFLAYLLDQLSSQGIREVLLLVGYLGQQIVDYCGDGRYWGLHIKYVESPVKAETGQRLRDAASFLDPHFLLMYCDDYWPLQLPLMWEIYRQSGSPAMLTVYANRDAFTRNNVTVDDSGRITVYDRLRTASGLNGVEIGYSLMSKEVLDYLPEGNITFQHTVYPSLASLGLLSAYWTEHRYYSIGSTERLPATEAFLKPQKAVILDRDGVLNERPPQAQYVRNWQEFRWLPGATEALRLLSQAGYKLILATNQPGIARGVMSEDSLAELHGRMRDDLVESDVSVDAIYHCPHGWDDGCFCRKPRPGMLFQAQREHYLDLTKTLFVGDDPRDIEAGQAAGCLTALVSPEVSLLGVVQEYLAEQTFPILKRG